MTVSWITVEDVKTALGIEPASVTDDDYLDMVTAAAQDWCYDMRAAAGYTDTTTAAPSDRVKAGAILYAVALYRERGSVDSYSSFQEMPNLTPFGTLAQVKRLLGLSRPRVA